METGLRRSTTLLLLALALLPVAAGARDRGADGQFSERRSRHFLVLQDVAFDRYSGASGSRQFERDVLATLESAYSQVRDVLGIGPTQELLVKIYDPGVFDRDFNSLFRFRAAGFYNGVIHVRGSSAVDAGLVSTLHHEYTHAALNSLAPPQAFPGWLNEGLAEYFERLAVGQRYLTPHEYAALRQAVHGGAWIPLEQLSMPSFASLGSGSAALAYLESYAVVGYLLRSEDFRTMRRLCELLPRASTLTRALQRTYRADLAEIESRLLDELR